MLFLYDWTILFFYVVIFSFFLLSLFVCIFNENKIDNVAFILLSFFLVFFYGLRTNGSPDTYMYLNRFYNLGTLDDFEWSAPFYYLMKFFGMFGFEHYTYTILSSFVFVFFLSLSVFLIFKSASKTLCISLFALNWSVYDLATNTYRQGVASVLILFSIALFFKRRFFFAFVFLFLSIGFHWSAVLILLLALVAFFINKEKLIKIIFVFVAFYFLFSLFGAIGFTTIIAKMDTLFYAIGDYTGYNIGNKQNAYLNDGVYGAKFYDYPFLKRVYSTIDFILPLVFAGFYIFKKKPENYLLNEGYYFFCLFCVLSIYFIFLMDMTWFFRNMYWVVMLSPIVVTKSLCLITNANAVLYKNKRVLILFVLMFYLLISLVSNITLWRSEIMRLNFFESY